MDTPVCLSLEDVVVVTYAAVDDALRQVGVSARQGKLIPRRGPAPAVDDREILCLALFQELLGFPSDNQFQLWLAANPTLRALFPRRLSRQNFADRRALLRPLLERLSGFFCTALEGGPPPFSSSTPIPWTSVVRCARGTRLTSGDWPPSDAVPPCAAGFVASGSICS
jgi:hypothetical protein